MRLRLRVSRFDNVADYSVGKRFRFAVVDLDKGRDYPLNFACLLPLNIKPEVKSVSIFRRVFREESLPVAKRLLAEALEREVEAEVRGEIERRLRLLEPKPVFERPVFPAETSLKPSLEGGLSRSSVQRVLREGLGIETSNS